MRRQNSRPISRIYKSAARGFAFVTAIFLVVVLSALGVMMLSLFTTQQQGSAVDFEGPLAYQAAKTGIEWAALGIANTAPGTLWAGCATGETIPANQMGGNLAPFNVTVTCTWTTASQGTATVYVYDITSISTGLNGVPRGSPDFVSRSITARMAD